MVVVAEQRKHGLLTGQDSFGTLALILFAVLELFRACR